MCDFVQCTLPYIPSFKRERTIRMFEIVLGRGKWTCLKQNGKEQVKNIHNLMPHAWLSENCDVCFICNYTKNFLSLTRDLLKKKSSCLFLNFRLFSSWFIRLSIHDCKKGNITDAGFYMIRNRAAKTCKNIHCNGEMSRQNKVLISRI